MTDMSALRQRAREFDRLWRAALPDTARVFDQAEAEGFHAVKVEPPDMFAHEDELSRLVSFQAKAFCP